MPEAGAILFALSVEDAVAIRMDDQDSMLGENNLAAEIDKKAQADEGMGEGGHNMPLHSRWWEGWGCAGGVAVSGQAGGGKGSAVGH